MGLCGPESLGIVPLALQNTNPSWSVALMKIKDMEIKSGGSYH